MEKRDHNPQLPQEDPEKLLRLLEIEMHQKRAGWQRTAERRHTTRTAAFLFLVLVIAGALFAWYFVSARAPARAQSQRNPPLGTSR
jgi:hypothetical protein